MAARDKLPPYKVFFRFEWKPVVVVKGDWPPLMNGERLHLLELRMYENVKVPYFYAERSGARRCLVSSLCITQKGVKP